jgi:hypothetical protein
MVDRIRQGSERTEELNSRISFRNLPSSTLQAQFDIRPTSTKYAFMPIFDRRAIPTVSIETQPTYDVGETFNPGTAQAPWSGFATNIDGESRLRNQFFALQRGAGQSCYIPSKNSDMYESKIIPANQQYIEQPFPSLFEKERFDAFNPCPKDSGISFFDNFTRQQLKDIA